MNIGAKLKAAREEKGISVKRLSHLSGISWVTIYRIESDEHSVNLLTLEILAEAIGCKLKVDFVNE